MINSIMCRTHKLDCATQRNLSFLRVQTAQTSVDANDLPSDDGAPAGWIASNNSYWQNRRVVEDSMCAARAQRKTSKPQDDKVNEARVWLFNES